MFPDIGGSPDFVQSDRQRRRIQIFTGDFIMSKKPTVLMILDGFGLNDNPKANAVYEAKTPNIDRIMAEYPFVKGNASGPCRWSSGRTDG